jgi:hypothetical protein
MAAGRKSVSDPDFPLVIGSAGLLGLFVVER